MEEEGGRERSCQALRGSKLQARKEAEGCRFSAEPSELYRERENIAPKVDVTLGGGAGVSLEAKSPTGSLCRGPSGLEASGMRRRLEHRMLC